MDLLQTYHNDYADKDWAKAILDRFPLPDQKISIFYIGCTTRTPAERASEDQYSTHSSRLHNLLKFVDQEVDMYEWVKLSQPCGTTKADYRRYLTGQNIERNLIALGGPFPANSASGGFTYDWAVPEHIKEELGRFQEYVQYRSRFYHTVSSSRLSPDPAMRELLTRNFQLMRDHFVKNQGPGETVATDECLKELVDAGSRPAMVKNQAISAFVTKDITIEALAGGFAYDDAAGPAPRLEHHLRKCVAEILTAQIDDADVFPQVRTDLFPCTTRHAQHLIHLLFLSNYLTIVQPILLIFHSLQALHIFQYNLLHTCWQSRDSPSEFMASLKQLQHTHTPLEAAFGQRVESNWANIKLDSSCIEALGRISVIKFGPRQEDYCLLLPERETLATCDTTHPLGHLLVLLLSDQMRLHCRHPSRCRVCREPTSRIQAGYPREAEG